MVGALVYLFFIYFFLLSAWRGGEHFPFSFPNSSSVLFFQVQVQPSTTVRSSVLLLRWWWWWWGRIFQQVATLSLSLSLHGVCLFFLFYTLYLSFLLDTTTKGKTTMRNHYPRGKRKYLLTFIFLLLLTRAEANDRTYPLRFGREEGRLLFFFLISRYVLHFSRGVLFIFFLSFSLLCVCVCGLNDEHIKTFLCVRGGNSHEMFLNAKR